MVPPKTGDGNISGREALSTSNASNNDANSTFSNLVSLDDGSSNPSKLHLTKKLDASIQAHTHWKGVCSRKLRSRLGKVLHIGNRSPKISYSHRLDPIIRSRKWKIWQSSLQRDA